ncbi:MAG: hypothetical protein GXP45_05340 [bacterium]|nr:hypothetical protein [bacterium]
MSPIPQKRESLINIFMHYNSKLNLSAIREAEDIFVKHIQDALELEKIFSVEENKNIADIGT